MVKEMTLSDKWTFTGDRLFRVDENCLQSIAMPTSIEKINGQIVTIEELTRFSVPSHVTRLGEYCFANCVELREIEHLEEVKSVGKGYFMNCVQLETENYPLIQ